MHNIKKYAQHDEDTFRINMRLIFYSTINSNNKNLFNLKIYTIKHKYSDVGWQDFTKFKLHQIRVKFLRV